MTESTNAQHAVSGQRGGRKGNGQIAVINSIFDR